MVYRINKKNFFLLIRYTIDLFILHNYVTNKLKHQKIALYN
jgi:hypothetical protein